MSNDNEINIKVTATTDELGAGLNKATGEVKSFGNEINDLAQRVQAVNPTAFKEVAQEFNAGRLDLDQFRDGLIGISAASSVATTEAKALAEGTAVSSSAMRELVVVGRELASGNLTRLPGSLSILASRLGGIPPVAILATAAIAGLGYAIYEAIDSSERFEADLTKLQNAFAATGTGGAFNGDQLTTFIDQLRQIPGVTGDAATSISNEFARTRNSAEIFPELVSQVKPFAELIGKDVPQAAKELAEAFNDPVRGLKLLEEANIEINASSQEQIRQMMAVNDVAGAQRVLFDALSASYVGLGDTFTSHQYFWQNLRNILGGVSEDANRTRQALEGVAAAYPALAGVIATRGRDFATRNLPNQDWSGSAGTVAAGDQNAAAHSKAEEQKKQNDAIADGVQLYDKGNSPLREQEEHLTRITRLQTDLNAAATSGNGDAAQKIQAQIDQENKLYAERLKRQEPKVKDDDIDQMLLDDQKADAAQIEGAAKVNEAKIKTAEDAAKEQYALGQITADQEAAQLIDLAKQSQAIEESRFDQLAELYKDDAAKYTQLLDEKQQAEQKYQQQVLQIETTAAQRNTALRNQEQQAFTQSAQRMIAPWESALASMGTRTNVWQQATIQAQRGVETNLVSGVSRMVANWILGENEKSAAAAIGAKFRQLTESQGATQTVENNIKNTQTNQQTDAVGVFTNVFNYLSPDLGPFAAVPAAASAAAVLALSIPSAAGGMVVPNDTLAMVHENEMILPAHLSQGIAGMIAGGQGTGGGNVTHNHTWNINANDTVTAKQLPDMIVKTMTKAMRNGQFGSMRGN